MALLSGTWHVRRALRVKLNKSFALHVSYPLGCPDLISARNPEPPHESLIILCNKQQAPHPEPIEEHWTLLASKDFRSSAADRMRDPYEAYYRHARRRDRADVAVVLGGFFLAVVLLSAVVFFWRTGLDERAASVNRENVVLSN